MMDVPSDNNAAWPYPVTYGNELEVEADVLILGGGASGCSAALAAARAGARVVVLEKGATRSSGAAGSGFDHWMDCPSNPASTVDPEYYTRMPIDDYKGGYGNYISTYITARDSYDVLLELEQLGMQVRDVNDEFVGAPFRDEETKFLYAYDYATRNCLRVWGTGLKPALHKALRRNRIQLFERTMATSLLTETGATGSRVVGCTAVNVRTGAFLVCKAKAVVMCMATPERLWIFSSELTGLVGRDGPPTNAGNGHAMAFRAGAEFARMESSTHEEWGGATGIGTVMFGSGSNFASWYPCSIVDANGKEVPWLGKGGQPLETVAERTHPRPEDGFFHLVLGPEEGQAPSIPQLIPDLQERIERGEYTLPLYANLPGMPAADRRAIFGLMIGQEGHTWTIYRQLTQAGFDPDKDQLQVCERGNAPLGWRRLRYGAMTHDWTLKTTLDGLWAAGQQVFDGIGVAQACSTGRWAGTHAAEFASGIAHAPIVRCQVDAEKARVYGPVMRDDGVSWKELSGGIAKVMQEYCGDRKNETLMRIGLRYLEELKEAEATTLCARNPHELMRAIEALDILTCCEMITHASLARQASCSWLFFERLDFPDDDPAAWHKWVTIRLDGDKVVAGDLALDYAGDLERNYAHHNLSSVEA
jgi:succinate dehydrogenase/fumarate reductase flavoprotein subunit